MIKSSLAGLSLLLALSAPHAFADPVITVTPWLAPNVYGSPSFEPAVQNELYAKMHGLTSYGPAGPTQYNAVTSPIYAAQAVVTNFNSWMGVANPGAPYGSELGNRMTFALSVVGTGGQTFSISQLSFNSVSSDSGDLLGFSHDAGYYGYTTDYEGVIYNDGFDTAGGVTYVTSGANTQLVNAIYGRGNGDSFEADCTAACTTAQEQAAIFAADDPIGTYSFTGTYSLASASGSGTFNVLPDPSPTPEPSSFILLGTGALSLAGVMRRRLVKR